MTRAQVISSRILFALSAYVYGMIEAFIFTHGFHPGAPTLFHTFSAGYHIPMAVLMLMLAYGYKTFPMIPAWILLEDISFWIFSGQMLSVSSWVSMGLGGVSCFGAFLPTSYLILFVLWLAFEFIARIFAKGKP